MNPALTTEQLEALRSLDASTLANAIETFHERLRNEGFVNNSIHCLCPQLTPMLGYAATIKIRGSAPPTVNGAYPERTDWWDYVLSVPAPRVLVVEDISSRPGLGSLVGAVHMNILMAFNCVGVVTNGSVRDIPAAQEAGFHFFAGSVTVSHAYVHIIEVGRPVQVGGLKVGSGELLHGELHGVQSIPADLATRIPAVAAKIKERERELIALCQSPEFSLEKLRAAMAGGKY
jgi:4-hydroxy-4-methyl-2-oxoglutarate aldolase